VRHADAASTQSFPALPVLWGTAPLQLVQPSAANSGIWEMTASLWCLGCWSLRPSSITQLRWSLIARKFLIGEDVWKMLWSRMTNFTGHGPGLTHRAHPQGTSGDGGGLVLNGMSIGRRERWALQLNDRAVLGLNCVLHPESSKFLCWSHDPQYLRMWLGLETGLLKR
jgi:hypothetical protein